MKLRIAESPMNMLPAERQKRILARIQRDGRVVAADLAEEFRTSDDTIRRDLRDFAAQGLCQRVYGGALAISPASGPSAGRSQEASARKAALGAALAALIRPRQLVYIDTGSTNLAAANALPEEASATICTHDPRIAAALMDRPNISVTVIGGNIDRHVGAALGGHALRTAANIRSDLLLLGVCALDAEAGIGVFNFEDAEMKRVLIESAGSVAVALLNDKLGAAAPYLVGAAESISDLVVEIDAPDERLAQFTRKGLRIHHAAPA
jgi:DeoR/GlpR family transcriptional regulator of sugar metabolism